MVLLLTDKTGHKDAASKNPVQKLANLKMNFFENAWVGFSDQKVFNGQVGGPKCSKI